MQAIASEISFLARPPRLWDISDPMANEELRGAALYEALMALKPAGLSEYEWAIQAGVNRGWFNDIKKNPEASPRGVSLGKVLAFAGKTMADLYGASPRQVEAHMADRPFNPGDLPRDVPIRGSAAGAKVQFESNGKNVSVEKTLVEPEPVAYARRPPSLARNRKVYAMFIAGDSMRPRFSDRDLVYVDPRRHPHIGEDVIVQLIEDINEGADLPEVVSVLVKQLVRATATHYELEQYNPPLTFRVPKSKVTEIHRIIPLSELLS